MSANAKFGGRSDYFAVNNKPMGASTSFRVSGRLGELAVRFWNFHAAAGDARRLNAAYRLGLKHGREEGAIQGGDEG